MSEIKDTPNKAWQDAEKAWDNHTKNIPVFEQTAKNRLLFMDAYMAGHKAGYIDALKMSIKKLTTV